MGEAYNIEAPIAVRKLLMEAPKGQYSDNTILGKCVRLLLLYLARSRICTSFSYVPETVDLLDLPHGMRLKVGVNGAKIDKVTKTS